MEDFSLPAPPATRFERQSPGQTDPTSAYRVGYDLLSRRAPEQALEVLEPALEQDPANTGLRMLRQSTAWGEVLMPIRIARDVTGVSDRRSGWPSSVARS